MSLLLVRHAHALPRPCWTGDDRTRDLSPKGRKQAAALVSVLSDFDPRRLVSSPYVRCVDTLEPLAAAIELEVETDDALAEGSVEDAVTLVRGSVSEPTVLCSHGDVIPAVLEHLMREDGIDIGPNPRNEKASVWVLRTKKSRFTRAEYIGPPRA